MDLMIGISSPANLFDQLDKKIMVWLRDGRTLVGYLRSVDQFVNLVLHQTIERIHVGNKYGDISREVFVIRGENVALVGEVDLIKEPPIDLTEVSIDEILQAQEIEQNLKAYKEANLIKAYYKKGIIYNPTENSIELLY